MRFRTVILAVLLTAAFIIVTSSRLNLALFHPFRAAAGRIWSGPDTAQSATLSVDESNNIEIYRSADPAVVNITSTVYRRGWFLDIVPQQGAGSGFLVRDDGLILTNYHVIAGGQRPELEVTLVDKSNYSARVLAFDRGNDVALIKIAPRKKLPFLRLGDSEPLQVGQKVLAIGNPFALSGTLTTGIISSLGRSLRDENGQTLENMIQTDAAINPGNSGGPLLDSHGNVVGINTAILGPGGNIGIGFALPVNRAKVLLEEYAKKGRFAPASLGVSVMYVSGDLAEALGLPPGGGLLIGDITPGSAADSAGLHGARRTEIVGFYEIPVGGDLITAIDGEPVASRDALIRVMNRKRPGEPLDLTIIRAGRTMKLRVKLGEAPASI